MDLSIGPNPPTQAEMRRYDAEWQGVAHRNLCVQLRAGTATIAVDGLPNFEVYYASPRADVVARENKDTIVVEAPSDPHSRASVCLGVAL